jgi:hypothetical protein
MSREKPLWGSSRVHGELLKLGIEVGSLPCEPRASASGTESLATLFHDKHLAIAAKSRSEHLLLHQVPDTVIPQPQTEPNYHADNNRKDQVEQGVASPQLTGDGPSEIAAEENCAKNRCARNNVKQRAGQEYDADAKDVGLWIPQLSGRLYDHRRLPELH